MGYERYPRNAGGNDERGYGRDADRNRDSYGARNDRNTYDDASYGDRAPRYRRDAGYQGQYAQGRSGGYAQDRYGQDRYQPDQTRGGYDDRLGRQDYGRPDMYGRDGRGQRDYGRQPQGYDYQERGFFDRAGDEVRSWFGDEDANRRRDLDARYDEQRYGSSGDDHYHSWRRSQIDALDRDYDEYRRENRSKFDTEFGSWRTQRQTQRSSLSQVSEHMDVVGSDGGHVGTVDKVRGDRIILTKNDADAGGRHHSIPSRWIRSVDDKVTIEKTADDAKVHWRDEERGAFFGDDANRDADRATDRADRGGNGPHVLGRSFSGTY